jgi:hypothetical protein
LFAGILLVVGTSLFLAEWLLGSLGWGVLHGLLLFSAVAIACGLAAVGFPGSHLGRAFIGGLIVAIVLGVALGLGLPNEGYTQLGVQALPGIEAGVRPLVVGVIIFALVGLVVGTFAGRSGGGSGLVGGALGGAVVGAVIGALSAIDAGPQVGAALAITAGYVTWIVLMVTDVARTGVDVEALKAKFTPTMTIETSKETLAWLQSKMPPGNGS